MFDKVRKSSGKRMLGKALGGIRVLEYCQMVSGPYCAKLLADLGAEVIKIEEPEVGDEARRQGPFPKDVPHLERSGLFLYVNTNKLGITLNLRTVTGKQIFRELVKETDILIEDKAPGVMEELGLDYQVLTQLNPSLIMTSVTPFGQNGPYRNYKAYHLNLYHASGASYFGYMGLRKQPPVKAGGYLGDYDAGLNAAVATLAAIFVKLINGIGQHIDISKLESLVTLDRVDAGLSANGTVLQRPGILGGLLRCRDGYVIVVVPQQHQWEGLVELMGRPEWTQSEKCRDEVTRSEHQLEIQPHIEEWAQQHTKEEIYHRGQALGLPVGPVNEAEDLDKSQQMKHRCFFVTAEHPEAGKLQYPAASYRFSQTPWAVERAAPLLGQHNEQVYSRLGLTTLDLSRMRTAGII